MILNDGQVRELRDALNHAQNFGEEVTLFVNGDGEYVFDVASCERVTLLEYNAAAREAVAKGVRLLNDRFGLGWESKVNPDTLDIEAASKCVLGQLGTDLGFDPDDNPYYRVARLLFGDDDSHSQAQTHGFATRSGISARDLNAEWRRVLPEPQEELADWERDLLDSRF